ncbi:uncharacterized protein LOC141641459 [Silene latifolia]|uniref:uncharacterized protein LOC141641459 n=1 Tax=Silene latifolia TaxID=37657 RepID=UPI003D77B9E9
MAGDIETSNTQKLDPLSSYYLGSHDVPGEKVSNIVLHRDNYDSWQKSMTFSLKARRKFGFIDGTIKKLTDAFELGNWVVVNCTLIQWIRNMINPTLLDNISYPDDASVLWSEIKAQYAVVDGTMIHSLKTHLNNCKQNKGMDVTTYYGKLKTLWDSIGKHEPPFACRCGKCECGIGPAAIKRQDNERLHQFFMGLDHTLYGNIRSSQFQLDPLPARSRAYNLVLQEEHLRIETQPTVLEVAIFATPHATTDWRAIRDKERNEKRGLFCSSCETRGHDAPSSRKTIGAGELRDGLFWIHAGEKPLAVHTVSGRETFDLWHRRLGHPSHKVVRTIPSFSSLISNKDTVCDASHLAKQHRDSFVLNNKRASDLFDLIHCDLWGPYRTASSCGAKYFLTIVDDYSRAIWVYLLLDKTEVSDMFMSFIHMVQTQFSKSLKNVRSDNGTEFNSMTGYFFQNGIKFETSCVGTPQQNGRVERKHRHILNVARALRFQANLPNSFWGECILSSAYLINRTPSQLLNNLTPYKCLYGIAPSYDNLRVFGCLAYAHNQNTHGDKFEKRSRKSIFVGYPNSKKGWKLYDLETESFYVSRDVIFHENTFPFAAINDSVTKTVMDSTPDSSLSDEPFNGFDISGANPETVAGPGPDDSASAPSPATSSAAGTDTTVAAPSNATTVGLCVLRQ